MNNSTKVQKVFILVLELINKLTNMDLVNRQYAYFQLIESGHVIIIKRRTELHNATLGTIHLGDQKWKTIELPWKDNQRNISRIPKGVYYYQKTKRYSNGKNCLWLKNVPNRRQILIHVGTKPSHSEGCILMPEFEDFYEKAETNGLIVIQD
jgi:hypothetical protein